MLEQDVRTSFVPVGQRYKMEGDAHHIVSNQQIRQRENRREGVCMRVHIMHVSARVCIL